jgi:hypothetical protein
MTIAHSSQQRKRGITQSTLVKSHKSRKMVTTRARAKAQAVAMAAMVPIAAKGKRNKSKTKAKTPKKAPLKGVNHSFMMMATDEQNAQGMIDYLLNGRQQRETRNFCCNKVHRYGCIATKCKCLMRITEDLTDNGTPERKEEWKKVFVKFGRVLRTVADASTSVSSLVQFMDEFRHVFQRQSWNNMKAYVVSTPINALLMDFNGIAELGGYEQRKKFKEFAQTYLTWEKEKPIPKSYVFDVYQKQSHLDAFLHTVEVCRQKKANPQNLMNCIIKLVMEFRENHNYYLTNRANYDYYKDEEDAEEEAKEEGSEEEDDAKQKTTDRAVNIKNCKDFIQSKIDSLIIAHPDIPLLSARWVHVGSEENSTHRMLITHGDQEGHYPSIRGNIGVLLGDLDGLAKKLVERLRHFVGWDGSEEEGEQDLSVLLHGKPEIEALFGNLKIQMEQSCLSLIPPIATDHRTMFFAEASLCPAPKLGELNRDYRWTYDKPMVPNTPFLDSLEFHSISSFWGFFPLTMDGMFVDTSIAGMDHKLIFVPYGSVLLCPMQIPIVDKLRTAIAGNPHCKIAIHIIPDTVDAGDAHEVLVQGGFTGHGDLIPFGVERGRKNPALEELGNFLGV